MLESRGGKNGVDDRTRFSLGLGLRGHLSQCSAIARVTGNTRTANQGIISLSSQSSRTARRLLAGKDAIPFRISPMENTLTKTRSLDWRRKASTWAAGAGLVSSVQRERWYRRGSHSQGDVPAGVFIALKVYIEAVERRFRKQVGQVIHLLMNGSLSYG